jgi:hypothetical protein
MNHRFHAFTRRSLAILLAVAGLAACTSVVEPSPEPTLQMVAGSYRAVESYGALSLTTMQDGRTIDWPAEGASVQLDLRADGTTTGRLFIPGAEEDGIDLDEDLAGSWTLSAGRVRLSHPADTFLRDMTFTFRDNRLEGDETFGGVRVRATLAGR